MLLTVASLNTCVPMRLLEMDINSAPKPQVDRGHYTVLRIPVAVAPLVATDPLKIRQSAGTQSYVHGRVDAHMSCVVCRGVARRFDVNMRMSSPEAHRYGVHVTTDTENAFCFLLCARAQGRVNQHPLYTSLYLLRHIRGTQLLQAV